MKYKRIFLIVMDSLGIGNALDAKDYDDVGANTLKHICERNNGLNVPYLEGLGLGSLGQFKGIYPLHNQLGYSLKLNEASNGKDTITGHWEMMGLKITKPFVTFTDTGFPKEFIEEFEKRTGRKCVGNIATSGTEILDVYGEHQMKTGDWIVYTSSDSVFQIAAHEDIIPLNELYDACQIAREIAMDDRYKVGRIIARPYIGKGKGTFKRTSNRHDYALKPFSKTVLNSLNDAQYHVIALGKISDIFVNEGINESIRTINNDDGMDKLIMEAKKSFCGLVFLNLVDFDAVYGHRRNPIGYGQAIEKFDQQLFEFMKYINSDDLVMITADHGNDPTYKGTDHTREQVPLIIYNKEFKNPCQLPTMDTFGIIGATIADNFNVSYNGIGKSILNMLD
ncbi:phosphopentomutase [Erysipelatoclostridium sp. AM42-17]|uniref:phosphopentomutase n=1 Tax=Erysipelatoclostridium sp. AM42-17 TaxID=2293102 RepID=UPI000E4DF268|nr:phosphopentomutase [Erysipelatoclostridium sp. AM42-17]RHS96377.1 phosphopentomutase [Erysipelatoclostridium sp. AM42-17]